MTSLYKYNTVASLAPLHPQPCGHTRHSSCGAQPSSQPAPPPRPGLGDLGTPRIGKSCEEQGQLWSGQSLSTTTGLDSRTVALRQLLYCVLFLRWRAELGRYDWSDRRIGYDGYDRIRYESAGGIGGQRRKAEDNLDWTDYFVGLTGELGDAPYELRYTDTEYTSIPTTTTPEPPRAKPSKRRARIHKRDGTRDRKSVV